MNRNPREVWDQYTRAWQLPDRAARLALLSESLAENAIYSDPLTQTHSWDDLIGYMESLQQQVPGAHFVVTHFLAHHQKSLASWEMRTGENITVGTGTSYGEYNAQGKLTSMNGFFEVGPVKPE